MTRRMLGLTTLLLAGLPLALPIPGRSVSPVPVTPVDLLTLKQALAPLNNANGVSISSAFTLTGEGFGAASSLHSQLKTTARRPGCFHIDLTGGNAQGTKQRHYVIVSNGAKVWIYDSDANKYSVTPFAVFNQSSHLSAGIALDVLYWGKERGLPQALQNVTAANSAEKLAQVKQSGLTLTEENQTAGGQNITVYRITTKKNTENFVILLSVSAGKQLTAVEATDQDASGQLTLREDISQMAGLPSVPASAFVFTPPLGATKSDDISITP